MDARSRIPLVLVALTFVAACGAPAASSPSPSSAPATSAAAPSPSASATANPNAAPAIPAPVAVTVDAKSAALLILDINANVCMPQPNCTATVPAIAALLKRARDAKVPVLYSTTVAATGNPPAVMAEVAPQAGEPTVAARADKFLGTNLDDLLKQRKATTVVIVGSAANGAVLYSSFHANALGYTVVVAEDGISSPNPFATTVARWQLLNQPGFANVDNKPLAERLVTLSRGDLVTFK